MRALGDCYECLIEFGLLWSEELGHLIISEAVHQTLDGLLLRWRLLVLLELDAVKLGNEGQSGSRGDQLLSRLLLVLQVLDVVWSELGLKFSYFISLAHHRVLVEVFDITI